MARKNVWIADMVVSDPAAHVGLKSSVISNDVQVCTSSVKIYLQIP